MKKEYENLLICNPDVEEIANENGIVRYRYFPK